MTPQLLLRIAIEPALALLPVKMTSRNAMAMMITIALQESRVKHRRQLGGGPARGFWQGELTGGCCTGIVGHAASRAHVLEVCDALGYSAVPSTLYAAIEHNDVLAAGLARLLLWTEPGRLPLQGEAQYGWDYYMNAWRPGRPHRETWDAFYEQAWAMVP